MSSSLRPSTGKLSCRLWRHDLRRNCEPHLARLILILRIMLISLSSTGFSRCRILKGHGPLQFHPDDSTRRNLLRYGPQEKKNEPPRLLRKSRLSWQACFDKSKRWTNKRSYSTLRCCVYVQSIMTRRLRCGFMPRMVLSRILPSINSVFSTI